MLTRESILAASDLPTETVDVPEWGPGEQATLRGMTAQDRDAFEEACFTTDGKVKVPNIRAQVVARCLVDASGARLFGDDQVAELARKNATVVHRLYKVATRLSGIAKTEELKGN
jgi:hypothetical protein